MKKFIISENYDEVTKILVHSNGKPVVVGERLNDWVVRGGRAPHKPSSCGFVVVTPYQSKYNFEREFYVTNYDLKWETAVYVNKKGDYILAH